MSRGLPRAVKDNLEKCTVTALAAVEAYNRPGRSFRTAQYLILITISWTALFHAIFYKRGIKPWYKLRNGRYEKIDGDPKHWDLSECMKKYYTDQTTPERKNLEFLVGLRNKIEHRHLPELDPSLYGECQACLINLESLLASTFGEAYCLSETLAVSLQFSTAQPEERLRAARNLARSSSRSVKDYVETFRGNLPSTVLSSMKYSYNVFLVPRVANRVNAADAAVQFVKVDEASPEELRRLEQLNVLIREKHIPIANIDLFKPSEAVAKIRERCPFQVSMNTHSDAWRHFRVRPASGSAHPERCDTNYCVYDRAHNDYVYTQAWIDKCVGALSDPEQFRQIVGRHPTKRPVA